MPPYDTDYPIHQQEERFYRLLPWGVLSVSVASIVIVLVT
jgi:hypothetical protein